MKVFPDLCDLWIQERDESKCSEWLRDEDVRDLAELGEVVLQVLRGHLLSATTDEHFARNLLDLALLRARKKKKIYV